MANNVKFTDSNGAQAHFMSGTETKTVTNSVGTFTFVKCGNVVSFYLTEGKVNLEGFNPTPLCTLPFKCVAPTRFAISTYHLTQSITGANDWRVKRN